MLCNHCKKEEETITIAGKTYCANCSTVLEEKKVASVEVPKHKIPKLETTDNPIRTEEVQITPQEISPEIQELSRETKIPEVSKDDLEGSAILLDILSDNAKNTLDNRTLNRDKDLLFATNEVISALEEREEKPKVVKHPTHNNQGKVMNDIKPVVPDNQKGNINKGKGVVDDSIVFKERKDDEEEANESLSEIIIGEGGYTKEYDTMIMAIALTAIVMVILAIFMTFR